MVWSKDANDHAGFSEAKPWLPVKEPQRIRAVDNQEGVPTSVLNAYRESIAFRKNSSALVSGTTEFIDIAEPVLAFHRTADGQTITCIFNLSPNPVTITVEGEAAITGPSQAAHYSEGSLKLGANGFVYLDAAGNQLSVRMGS